MQGIREGASEVLAKGKLNFMGQLCLRVLSQLLCLQAASLEAQCLEQGRWGPHSSWYWLVHSWNI